MRMVMVMMLVMMLVILMMATIMMVIMVMMIVTMMMLQTRRRGLQGCNCRTAANAVGAADPQLLAGSSSSV